jgi:NADH-quinone oxidoreductase subunit E
MNATDPSKTTLNAEVKIDYTELDKVVRKDFNNDKENLIMIIQAIQRRYNYLPEPALKYIAARMGVPLSRIYGIATFYSTFSLNPRGRNIISICLGTACHVRGGERVRERIEGSLNIKDGETTNDRRFTLDTVRCIGCCSLGPVVKINDEVHGHLSSEQIEKIIDRYE